MLNQTKTDNQLHNKLNHYFHNVYYHKMVVSNEHNKNAKKVIYHIKSMNSKFKPQHAIVSQEH
jgi:hypothetical protein